MQIPTDPPPSLIIGVMGQARTGKDTLANYIIGKYRFVRIGMADPLKRFCKEVFNFTDEQLWGNERDKPDLRYLRRVYSPDGIPLINEPLTPRFALQTLGTEWGRNCYPDIWAELGVRTAKDLLQGYAVYSEKKGLEIVEKDVGILGGVVFSDIRFKNEFSAIKNAGGYVVRVKRPNAPAIAGIANHPSEMEQMSIPDHAFDYIIDNDVEGLEHYHKTIDEMVTHLRTVAR